MDGLIREAVFTLARAHRGNERFSERTDAFYRRRGAFAPLVLGHRGAMARAPENTLGAFAAAIDDGGDGIELDVQLSQDDVPIVLHDDTLDRTSDRTGTPRAFTAAELDAIDVGTWFGAGKTGSARGGWGKEKVPRLHEVFDAMPDGAVVNVELKGPTPRALGLERRVADVIAAAMPRVQVVVSSFHPAQLLVMRETAPDIPLALLIDRKGFLPLRTGWALAMLLPDAVHPHRALVDAAFVAGAHRAGMRVHPWGIKKAAHVEQLLDLGVDGVIVDDVKEACDILARRTVPPLS